MNSIRKRVLWSILGVLTLAALAVGIATYLGIRHEMDELYDANMRQLAVTASGMAGDRNMPEGAPAYSKKWPRGEQIFLIQIWKGERLDYSSHPIAHFPLQGESGFGRAFFNGKKWSYYQESINGKTIQVSQVLSERRDVIREVYKAVIIPTLIQFPIAFVLVWLLVSAGFRPLRRISDMIQKRKAGFLEPIPPGDAPDEIRVLVVALNDLMARLDSAMETQRRFTADAAHELRTPLTAVRLQLDLLQRADTEGARAEAAETLERGVSRSIHLVQQLLELARQEPEAAIEPRPLDLAELVRAVAREQAPLAAAKGLSLTLALEPAPIEGDEGALSVMAGNLLSNAIAYTEPGGAVVVRAWSEGERRMLEVSDDGIGIAPADRARIFDRFYRVIGTQAQGSGLGLSIVRTIVERHGAKIIVSNGLNGRGTSFRIVF